MNKTEWIEAVQGRAHLDVGVTRNQVEHTLNHALDVIREELAAGHTVNLTGFGKFEAKASPAREGRNPKTGAPLRIEAGRRVRFAPGKNLKQALNA